MISSLFKINFQLPQKFGSNNVIKMLLLCFLGCENKQGIQLIF